MSIQNENEAAGFSAKRNVAAIGPSVTVRGDIASTEELFVDGNVNGKLECSDRLTIGPNGKVQAGIKAREVVVLGTVTGNMEVEQKLMVRKGGCVVGDVKTAGLIVEDGAHIKGNIDMIRSSRQSAG